jgi:23S rRNA (adenine2030-N6)-methyltransferase
MNYRHHFHAGNFADVMKHALVWRLARALQKKDKGVLFLDTHAGRGGYDLESAATGDSQARRPEWPDGIGRLESRTDVPPSLSEYLAFVREHDRRQGNISSGLRFYPGSPLLWRELARPQDRLVLCEKHAEEHAALARTLSLTPRTVVQLADGYQALRAHLPPPERRALIMIDPPFEAPAEFADLAAALLTAWERFSTGVFAVWYPLTERARVDDFLNALRGAGTPPALTAELTIAGERSTIKMRGCGLLVLNPPWQFDDEARALLKWIAPVLAQEPGGAARVGWLVPAP